MDKLDMSLDDIIKKDKIKVGGRGRGRGSRGTSRGRGFRQNFGGRGRGFRSSSEGVRGGRVQQRRGRGASSSFTRSQNVPDVWEHDKFEGAGPVRRLSGGGAASGSGKLLVSNLDFGVNDSDVRELFAEFGQLKKASVHYDRSGRSIGTAEIIFELRTDAVKALKQYNNVPLDGRAMKIQLVGADPSTAPVASRLSRGASNRSPRGGSRGSSRGMGRGRGGRGGGRGGGRKPVSKEELDAELDAYNSKMETD